MSDDFGEWEHRQNGINLMSDIMSAFDDIEEGRKSSPSKLSKKTANNSDLISAYDIKRENALLCEEETKKLLYALHDVTGEYNNIHHEYTNGAVDYNQTDLYEESELDSIYGNYIPRDGENYIPDSSYKMRPVQERHINQPHEITQSIPKPYIPGMNWSIVEETVMGMKNAIMYSVKCNATNQIVLSNIMMYESALALRNILNDGNALTDPKVLGIISSGIQYTQVVKEAIKAAKERQQVLKESQYDKASELDSIIAEHKNKAKKLKQRVLNFLEDEGFIK